MTLNDAVLAMKQGKKVRLPWWGGYWSQLVCTDTH